ncbi:hypothetical protein EMPS_04129 [Entomortierella parvispora]|uniref:NACHT domain-containing protein n=1 Tax=Entomortierella parvispora TaxID=205924 RepID=A0A9P3H834_9FUNG|nr:hypothetical protein EMPS_04129 [Entomortierella parvispora]
MPLSAENALEKARIEIESARKARGSKRTIKKHYRAVKKILSDVDSTTADTASLKGMITSYQDLAAILSQSGDQGRATKCELRGGVLKQEFDKRMRTNAATISASLVGPGFSSAMQAGVVQLNSSEVRSSLSRTITPTATTISTSPVPQLPALPIPQTIISVSVAHAIASSPPLFSKDVRPKPYICPLPGPGEPLQSTHQLAYCLALLQPSVQENDIPPNALQWRRCTLENADEKYRLESLAVETINAFAKDAMKDAATVAEVVRLAPVLNSDHSRFLLKIFIDTVNQSEILQLHSLEGLAKVIQGAAPGSIDSGDLVNILRSLHRRLGSTHSESHHNQYLMAAVSRVLDAMADAHVRDVDRINLHEPLTDLLRESESSENPYLTFQAAYATQALLNVSDDDNIWRAGFRRGCLVLKGGAGFAKMPDLTEIADALEGLEKLYQVGKGGARPMFQWGICELLGQFAAETQWDEEARREAITFITAIYKDEEGRKGQRKIGQVVFDVLTNWTSNNGTCVEVAKPLLEKMAKRDTTLKLLADLQSPPWMNTQSEELTGSSTTKVTLLKTVQDRTSRHAKLKNLPDLPPQPNLDDIQCALKTYHAPDLFIMRVSGKRLDLETCFVNLAIVEAPDNREMEKQDLQEQAAIFHRIPSFESVNANTQSLIPLEQLFDKRNLQDGEEAIPKRILVQGRAGIGKTTLCKKLVHAHQSGLWRDLFDTVVWIPLRQLRGFKSSTLESLFRERVFHAQNRDREQEALACALMTCAEKGRVLFILDGLDEVVTDAEGDESRTFRSFLKVLLSQQHVVITSRPSGVDSGLLPPIDLELETIGFSQQNVNDFLVKVLEPEAVKTVQDFIQRTPLIRGLVNIPVQLDVICFSWDSLPKDGPPITMTGLYQLMVWKLWCKDALRLKKIAGVMTERQIGRSKAKEINDLMATELQHLGYLAFKGLSNNHQIEFDEDALVSAFGDLEYRTADNRRLLSPQVVEVMKQTSFLHTADVGLDSIDADSPQAWHFLHLTFQEYFAATWIVRHFHRQPQCSTSGMMTTRKMTEFIHQHKYNPQYEIVWTMVAGLLDGEPLNYFFDLLQRTPRDLIGGRHQQVLATCLEEARDRLDSAVASDLDSELANWLHFEMKLRQHKDNSRSMLGSRLSFPEDSLFATLSSVSQWKTTLIHTLRARRVLSDSAFQFLLSALKDEVKEVRSSAASALSSQSALPESVIQCLIDTMNDKAKDIRSSAATVLSKQSALPESAIQSLISALSGNVKDVVLASKSILAKQSVLPESVIHSLTAALKDKDGGVRFTALSVLDNRSTLPESIILPIIAALKDDHWKVRSSAASVLGNQPVLSESAILSLIATLKDDNRKVKTAAASALSNHSTFPESAIEPLITTLRNEDSNVRSTVGSILGKQIVLSESAFQSLIALLTDANSDIRTLVGSILDRRSDLSESAFQSLTAILKDGTKNARISAAMVLRNQSGLSGPVILSLIAALKDEERRVGGNAVSALKKQSKFPEYVIEPLIVAIKNDDSYIRGEVLSVLNNLPAFSESALLFATAALKGEHGYPRSFSSLRSILGKQPALPKSVIQSLAAIVKSGESYEKSLAAGILCEQSKLPESTIQPLIALLRSEERYIRDEVASALGNHPALPESLIQSLTSLLNDDNEFVGSSAAVSLGKQSTLSEPALHALITSLRLRHWRVRSSAAWALGEQSALPESAVPFLVAVLKDDNGSVRSAAARALSKQTISHASAIRPFVGALRDDDLNVLNFVEKEFIKRPAVIVAALKDEDKSLRFSAALALRNQSELPESVIHSLLAALKDEYHGVRMSAAEALGRQSKLPESAIEPLIAALGDENKYVRSPVAMALIKLPVLPESAIPSVTAALKDEDKDARESVASVLSKQPALPEATICALIAALKDDHWRVGNSAELALSKQSTLPESAIHLLVVLLKDEEDKFRKSAASVLSKQSTFPRSAIQFFIAALKEEGKALRYLAVSVLDKQPSLHESAIEPLIALFKDEDEAIRSSARSALSKQSVLPDSALQSLLAALRDEDKSVRISAVSVLDKHSILPVSAIEPLIAALRDGIEAVRSSARSSLRRLPALPESAFKSLIDALWVEDKGVRRAVSGVLRDHTRSLCNALPHLTGSEMACLYDNYLFLYSCSHVMSLQVQDNMMVFYTEQGQLRLQPFNNEKEQSIKAAIRAVQHKAGLKS